MARVVESANQGDEGAIELLLNLSAGSLDSSKDASDALMRLYANPDSPESVRTIIEIKSLSLFELEEAIAVRRSQKAIAGQSPVTVPTRLLYLAGHHASQRQPPYEAALTRIESELMQRVGAPNQPLLDPKRLISFGELQAGATALRHLKVHPEAVVLNLEREAFTNEHLNFEVPGVAFISVREHWVTLALCQSDAPGQKVDCLIFDSDITSSRQKKANLQLRHALKDALGDRLGKMGIRGGNLQSHATCSSGAFASVIARELDGVAQSGNFTFERATDLLVAKRTEWTEAGGPQREAMVTVERASLLSRLADAAHADAPYRDAPQLGPAQRQADSQLVSHSIGGQLQPAISISLDDHAQSPIDQLKSRVQTGDQTAITTLVAAALEQGESGALADSNLHAIYGDPGTKNETRQAIELACFESHKSGVQLPVRLLYLAGQYLESATPRDPDAVAEVNSRMRALIDPGHLLLDDGENLVTRGRLITWHELHAGVADLRNVRVHGSPVRIDSRATEYEVNPELKPPMVLFANLDGKHWVTVSLSAESNGKTACVVFDSDFKQLPAESVERFLKGSVRNCGQIHYMGGFLQQYSPNSCGAYAALAARELDRAAGDKEFTFEQVIGRVKGIARVGSARQFAAMITVERGRLLSSLAGHVKSLQV